MKTEINFTRINNDVNGNPRYVCHFLDLLKDGDEDQIKDDFATSLSQNPFKLTDFKYNLALSRAHKLEAESFIINNMEVE